MKGEKSYREKGRILEISQGSPSLVRHCRTLEAEEAGAV
jgi:hypothetical protein